jgi:Tfp pilus assembly protein PilF
VGNKYPNSFELHSNYALFLTNIRENHDQAEEHYKKSLELEPDNAIVNGNYAFFLTNIRENHDQTEAYYKKALKLEPDNANINGNYALFLTSPFWYISSFLSGSVSFIACNS